MFDRKRLVNYGLLYFNFVIYSFVSVFAKYASMQESYIMVCVFASGEVLLLGIYAILWQQILKRFPLVVAIANKGVTVVFGLLWSALLFNEQVTMWNLVGAGVIIAGIWMVSTDE